ncbi:MAG: oxygen-dependent coproporphyrinogen oxidase [Deltaproteobacteria bacterium]|nr:MAG: oxygen-dependent coproporphyrinogen oxidase [Deltaproteobacteria bacterium]
MQPFRAEVEQRFRDLRDRIVAGLEALEPAGAKFNRRAWQRPGGGGGEMSELRGELFEKGGCNFSAVSGERYPFVPEGEGAPAAEELQGKPFFAAGVSLVMHPHNPFVPVVHMNVRYLAVGSDVEWFGGGMDLTPFKPFAEDTAHFHGVLQKVCGPERYARFSRWAKEYFFIKHRNSERGVGGIFFDYLRGKEDGAFAFAVGDSFLPAYAPIVEKRRGLRFSEADRAAQLRWRGRYVEFNLLYDRGTIFGLKSGGNPDAIFMSLPPLVSW